ncbi:DUF5343 domain-containing protein [Mycobacterium sp. IS-3022]|uniref:DUF5343 domain-containing protein n=1 Tax=Mycobacterium sp. IS-3022 TaxID=1772277 RepID=UPI00074168D5|nr:DUF5343 domain-containing protein [Mycobacterium sp. IS-3022]KUI04451.1 hypothetical protein AU188_03925 [Mycobacterium sp. IS-3022]
MADDEPTYTTTTGKLSLLLKKIRETGIPPKANTAWLKSMGFNGGNDTTMLRVLRYIGFIDAASAPTPAWSEYRGRDHKEVLGRAIKTGYQDLYAVYPDAHDQPNTDLAHVFSTSTKSGKAVVDKMVATFKALVAEAEFSSDGSVASASNDQETGAATNGASQVASAPSPTVLARTPTAANGLTVNINVQLTLPEGADEQTFEAFFKAMKTHLFPDPE